MDQFKIRLLAKLGGAGRVCHLHRIGNSVPIVVPARVRDDNALTLRSARAGTLFVIGRVDR